MDSNRGIGAPAARYVSVPASLREDPVVRALDLAPDEPGSYPWISDELRPSIVGYMDNNVPLAAVQLEGATTPSLAAIKDVRNGGPLEVLASEIAHEGNAGRLVERVHRLPNGDAAIPFIVGDTAEQVGIFDGRELSASLTSFHAQSTSHARAGVLALEDMSRMVGMDATLGMYDRSWRNIMIRPDDDMRLIDHEALTQFDARTPRPSGPVPLVRLFHDYVDDGTLPIERIGNHWELPIPDAIADDIGRMSETRLRPVFELARADAIAGTKPGQTFTRIEPNV